MLSSCGAGVAGSGPRFANGLALAGFVAVGFAAVVSGLVAAVGSDGSAQGCVLVASVGFGVTKSPTVGQSPGFACIQQGYISNWPEEATARNRKISNKYGQTYLKLLVQIDDVERSIDVEHEIRWETLRTVASRRAQEIAKNFAVPLDFDEWPVSPVESSG